MGKSTMRGPDWLDVAMMVEALSALHGVNISVECRPMNGSLGTQWAVELCAVSTAVGLDAIMKTYRWRTVLSHGRMEELTAALFNGCYELEKQLAAGQWIQMEIPKA